MKVKLYVEGGGDGKDLRVRCREGVRKLIERVGFERRRMPAIIACGGRDQAFDWFAIAATGNGDDYPLLLVDSEDPVVTTPWVHLNQRDQWHPPAGVNDDQAQLMVTCMETWIMADRMALRRVFGQYLQGNALLPLNDLETRSRHQVQDALEHATRNCGKDRSYRKGRRSFQILAELDPNTLRNHLPYFERFFDTLNNLCT